MNNKELFNPINNTISEIFNCDKIYRIPNFQRPYSWMDEQLDELWDDLITSFKSKEENNCYFLGSIVVVDTDENIYQDVIDVQQRITTLMIMFNVLSKSFANLNSKEKLDPTKNIVTKVTVDNRIQNDNGYSRLQLQSYKDYDSTFKNAIINRENFDQIENERIAKNDLKSNNPKFKYLNTAKYFYKKFKKLEEDDEKSNTNILGDFINYIFYNVNIIKIVCTKQSFAIKLFQVLNDRGLNLTNSDIIKANIIEKLNDNTAIDIFENNWKMIETIANDYDFTMDDFFVFFEYFKLKSNPTKQLSDEINGLIAKENISDFINEMTKFAEKIKEVYTSKNHVVFSLLYLPWKFYIITILTSALYVDYPNKNELLKKIRRFYYLAFISGKTLNGIKQTSFNIIAKIVNKEKIEEISLKMDEYIQKEKLITLTYEAINSENVYGERWLKPLLMSIDYYLNEIDYFIPIDKKINVDHILPIAFSEEKNKSWDYIDAEEAKKVINTIGNMALLSETKNKSALNKGFNVKINIYQGLDEKGNLYTDEDGNKSKLKGFTNFTTTAKIVTDYLASHKMWDITTINDRKENYIIKMINSMLDINENMKYDMSVIQSKEINKIEYNENAHFEGISDNIKNLYEELKKRIIFINNDILVEVQKNYIAFKLNTNIVDVIIQKNNLLIYINLKEGELYDPLHIMQVTQQGHHGNGEYFKKIYDSNDIDKVIPFIAQSYEKHK